MYYTSSGRDAERQLGSLQPSCHISLHSLQCGTQYLPTNLATMYVHKQEQQDPPEQCLILAKGSFLPINRLAARQRSV